MLNEILLKEYPIQKDINRSSLYIARQSHKPLQLASYSASALEGWIMRNAQVHQPASRRFFRDYIRANLKGFLTGEKTLYHISRVDLFPDRIIIVLECEEYERLEIGDAVARERLVDRRRSLGLPEDEGEDEDEEKAAQLWYDASHEDHIEWAARIGRLFPELEGHLEEIRGEVEVCLTGDVYLHLVEEVSTKITDEYKVYLQDIGFNLKITRGNGFSRHTLLDGNYNWKDVDNTVMVGTIHKDHYEIYGATSLG